MRRRFSLQFKTAATYEDINIPHDVKGLGWEQTLEALPGIVAAARTALAERGRPLSERDALIGILIDPHTERVGYLAEGIYTGDGGSWAEEVEAANRDDAIFQARWTMAENEGTGTPDELDRFVSLMRAQRVEVSQIENAPRL